MLQLYIYKVYCALDCTVFITINLYAFTLTNIRAYLNRKAVLVISQPNNYIISAVV